MDLKEIERKAQGKRLRHVIELLMLNANEFFSPLDFKARGIDVLRQIERGSSGISQKLKREISQNYPSVNLDYLEKGYGAPLKNSNTETSYTYEYTPFYDYGIGEKPGQTMEKWEVNREVHIHVPFFKCNCYIRVNSESMQPRIKRGDVIALRKLNSTSNLPYGKTFYIVTPEHHFLYKIRKSKKKGYFTLYPESEDFDKIELKESDVLELFIVTGQLSQL